MGWIVWGRVRRPKPENCITWTQAGEIEVHLSEKRDLRLIHMGWRSFEERGVKGDSRLLLEHLGSR